MSIDKAVSENYLHGDLLKAIQAAITKLGKTVDSVTIEDLAPVDEFHIGGRLATESFLEQLNFSEQDHVMRQKDGELVYPVPWATESSTSKLSTLDKYRQASG